MSNRRLRRGYSTNRGTMFNCKFEKFVSSGLFDDYRSRVQLIFTSPPFPLNTKKRYGNLTGDQYVHWLSSFAPAFNDLLKKDGSLIVEVGNSWEKGSPTMSTLALEALLKLKESGSFSLCQQFIWYNPARLPSPAQWVNIERVRVKDAFTHIWWLAKSANPKSNNKNVLVEYSHSMKRLLASRKYNSGERPSQHVIGSESFFVDNKGAIPSNVITVANTASNDRYLEYCRRYGIKPHPARMPPKVAEFFIKFLTSPRNLVMDPFGGSNVTGYMAEMLKRRWIVTEPNRQYLKASRARFPKNALR